MSANAGSYSLPGRITINKGGAVVIWLLGAFTTAKFAGELGVAEPINYFVGLVIQFFLTKAQAPLWRAGERRATAVTALVIDAGLNAAGLWPYLINLGATSFWMMVSQWIGSDTPPNMLTRILFTIILAVLTAAGPEILYEQED